MFRASSIGALFYFLSYKEETKKAKKMEKCGDEEVKYKFGSWP
jgi:preprotein translocase subunit YajC